MPVDPVISFRRPVTLSLFDLLACPACGGSVQRERADQLVCPACGRDALTVELGEAMAARVIASDGSVKTVAIHQPLAAAGGVAAELRFPL